MKHSSGTIPYRLYGALVCLLLCAVLLVGNAWGHFSSQTQREVSIAADARQPLYLQPVNGEGADVEAGQWSPLEGGGYTMSFALRNYRGSVCGDTARTASLLVLAGLGIAQPQNLTIKLYAGGSVYTGTPTDIADGTALAYSFGSGWCYRFYDAENKELTWQFPAGQRTEYRVIVTAETNEAIPYASMLRVQTSTRG